MPVNNLLIILPCYNFLKADTIREHRRFIMCIVPISSGNCIRDSKVYYWPPFLLTDFF